MIRIVFDTDCVACSRFVRFVLDHEIDARCQFISAWSQTGSDLAIRQGHDPRLYEISFMVLDRDRALVKSDAVLHIFTSLKAPWRWLIVLKYVPKVLRDAVYTFLARRRYAWFGRRESCFISPASLRERFVEPEGSRPVDCGR
ncbi:thiol-disulfide oxidoreductase DCC family protein [Rhizobium paranaense]|uniref:Putative DCC family thiol-disulfide oxidoreductase YuxK n=1 Tax=Rhizobium paranaense TaxID=1650438 RepID=A0A7W8XWT2_9HYPH|nr:DCC1-like thiol-disulfide oxidoreductase family protein [Rhizobium paranaense]MBB5576991.1 putative DCC family thiol-disulfide oxidoreductase YuxK [Rhizobium paranaense]